ncbi:hypothetical protein ACXPWS_07625 [Mycobacterium sp. BMJ-28]
MNDFLRPDDVSPRSIELARIAATKGSPYIIERRPGSRPSVLRLGRQQRDGAFVSIMLAREDIINVCTALVDALDEIQ